MTETLSTTYTIQDAEGRFLRWNYTASDVREWLGMPQNVQRPEAFVIWGSDDSIVSGAEWLTKFSTEAR